MPSDEAQDILKIKGDTVDTLVRAVRAFLKDEDGREQSFNTRAGGLAGFVGIIVTVATASGRIALDEDPSGLATVLGTVAFTVAMVALIVSLVIAVTKVLIPQEGAAIDMKTIEDYPNWRYISQDKVMIQGEILRGLIRALAKDRQRNSSKAKWLRRA
ncbi:MAG: hypothetical protein ACRDNG_06500 [Gaiellaceae bacterium]